MDRGKEEFFFSFLAPAIGRTRAGASNLVGLIRKKSSEGLEYFHIVNIDLSSYPGAKIHQAVYL